MLTQGYKRSENQLMIGTPSKRGKHSYGDTKSKRSTTIDDASEELHGE
jgi:hypothetical protein